jgi:ABC-type hemin transport system ATPase subunit
MHISFDYDTTYFPAFPYLEMTVSGKWGSQGRVLNGLIDSGSDATQIPARILRQIGADKLDERWVRDLSGIRHRVTLYKVWIQIGPFELYGVEVVGREGISEIIVGRDVLNQLIVTLNGLAQITEISD